MKKLLNKLFKTNKSYHNKKINSEIERLEGDLKQLDELKCLDSKSQSKRFWKRIELKFAITNLKKML